MGCRFGGELQPVPPSARPLNSPLGGRRWQQQNTLGEEDEKL